MVLCGQVLRTRNGIGNCALSAAIECAWSGDRSCSVQVVGRRAGGEGLVQDVTALRPGAGEKI